MGRLFYPFDQISVGDFLGQYAEWIYFGLLMVFFVAVAGVSLRRHFERPYVKPLVVAVGLMMTVGLFKFRAWVPRIFEGLGILGTVVLVMVVAVIPYGLTRGFGVGEKKAFYLTYVLIYILSWVQFPQVFYALGDKNLGLVNLVLLIVFLVAGWQLVFSGKGFSLLKKGAGGHSANTAEVDREIDWQATEDRAMRKSAVGLTRTEIKSLEDIGRLLHMIEEHVRVAKNQMGKEDREKIAVLVQDILKQENLFKDSIGKLQRVYKKMSAVDFRQLKEQKRRLDGINDKRSASIKAEIRAEEQKLLTENKIVSFEQTLDRHLGEFNQQLGQVLNLVRSAYPLDARPYLKQANQIFKTILKLLREVKSLEEQLLKLIKSEKKFLKKEKQGA